MVTHGVNLQEGYKVFIQQQIFSEHLICAGYVRKVREQNILAVWSLYPWGKDMQMTVSKNIICKEVVYSTDICS